MFIFVRKVASIAAAALALLVASGAAVQAQVTWYFDGPANTPAGILAQITASMDEAVDHYNAYSVYEWAEYAPTSQGVRVIYNENVPTANASYRGRIAFGGSRGVQIAMHELAHVFGVGTFNPAWTNLISDGKWQGSNANAELQRFDGRGATLNAGSIHFWPYGLNFPREDSPEARLRHVRMVGAIRSDMRLFNGNATELIGDFNNDGVTDAADYTVWRDRNGEDGSLVNDRTIGSVDGTDYLWWDRGYGSSVANAQSASVPEPTALPLVLLGVAAVAGRANRKA